MSLWARTRQGISWNERQPGQVGDENLEYRRLYQSIRYRMGKRNDWRCVVCGSVPTRRVFGWVISDSFDVRRVICASRGLYV